MAVDFLGFQEGLRIVMEPIPGVTEPGTFPARWPRYVCQCPPLEEFAMEQSFSYTDYDTIGEGQFSRKGGKQLRTISFDTLVVDAGNYALYDARRAGRAVPSTEEQVDLLQDLADAGEPFLFTAAHKLPPLGYDSWALTEIGPEVQMPVTMRSLRVSEKAGEGDARYVSASFTEYRETVVGRKRTRGGRKAKALTPDRPKLRPDGLMYDKRGVRIGRPPEDPVTLVRLARHYYKGNAAKWTKIAARNGLGGWGPADSLLHHPKYRGKGGIVVVPE